jgi:hypothetical protein
VKGDKKMITMESSSSSNKKSKRIGTTTITFVLAFSVAAFVASGVSYGAKPSTPTALNPTVCNGIGGVWSANTCTINETTSSLVSSGFKIYNGVVLDIKGSLTINPGVTIANAGTITVENSGGVSTPFDDSIWRAGILVYGTLDNSGTITIENESANTEGITVSVSVSGNQSDPSTYVVAPGTLTNSGTITIQNREQTRGIKNLGAIANSASGTITVANSLTSSVGIYNRRVKLTFDNQFYVTGTLTNAGSITILSSGDSNGYGIYNVSLFTNSTTGTFTIDPSPASDDAGGFYNAGSFTNYGTFTNNRGTLEALIEGKQIGSYNNAGTMINYGTTYAGTISAGTGTFYNNSIMINLGKITSHGIFFDESESLNGSTMINYGTFYNYGAIGGGVNKGICIDEPGGGGCG